MNSKHNETSPNQQSLWETLAAADAAIQQVDENAEEGWKRAADEAVFLRANMPQPFTTDDIMDDLTDMGIITHDNRALGPVIRRAIRSNTITEIGMTRSRRRHGARIPIYAGTSTATNEMRK